MATTHSGYAALPDNARLSNDPDEVMYEDKFVKLTASALFVKRLHLLSATTKFNLADIQALVPAVDYFAGRLTSRPLSFARRCLGVKLWGLSANGILWARDFSRCSFLVATEASLAHSFVARANNHLTKKTGFSVQDPAAFRAASDAAREGAGLSAL